MSEQEAPTKTTSHSKKRGWLRDIVIGVLIFAAVLTWTTKDMLDTDGSVKVSQATMVSLEGNVEQLLSESQSTLVYFFAPWCQICDLSIGNLAYLDEQKLNIVVVALDYQSREEISAFIERNDVTATVLMGTDELKSSFKIQGYPSYYLINSEHEVIGKSFGYSTALGLKLREVYGS